MSFIIKKEERKTRINQTYIFHFLISINQKHMKKLSINQKKKNKKVSWR